MTTSKAFLPPLANFALVTVGAKTPCTYCGTEVERELTGGRLQDGGGVEIVCEVCLMGFSEELGTALAGLQLMRQAAAHGIAGTATDVELGHHLITFARSMEKTLRRRWRRQHAVARFDCEHCFIEHCHSTAAADLDQKTLRKLRLSFRRWQLWRFEGGGDAAEFATAMRRPSEEKETFVKCSTTFEDEAGEDRLCSRTLPRLVLTGIKTPISIILTQDET